MTPISKTLRWIAVVVLAAGSMVHAETSDLWGSNGERWQPGSRLPDFSFAGFENGEAPLPDLPVRANVRDFGAVGDGTHDDTDAFRKGIETVKDGALLVPAGRYVITDRLVIAKSRFVLRGEGSDKSVLYFPKTLDEVKPNWGATTSGRRTSNYSWSGGFISVQGRFGSQPITTITDPAQRGDSRITVASAGNLKVGDWIEINQRDVAGDSLAASLYAGQPGPTGKLLARTRALLTAKVVEIDKDNRVTLNRELPFDVELRWQPRVLRFAPTVTHVGIEHLGVEFPVRPYNGHFTELGANPLALSGVAHCWARDLRILNADSGIFLSGRFCTLDGITLDSVRQPDRRLKTVGHHGISVGGQDNLCTGFRFNVRYIHDLTVSHSSGNVFSGGSGVDLCFDHHKRAPFANLFTDLDLGAGTRMYRSGGGEALGKHSAAWTTFWNIRAARPQSWPPVNFAPDRVNLVGVITDDPSIKDPEGRWFEAVDPKALTPPDLHKAQLQRRLSLSTSGARKHLD